MAKKKKKSKNTNSKYDSIYDHLIEIFLEEIKSKPEKYVKVGDLIKMIENRKNSLPEDSSSKKIWDQINRVREDVLSKKENKNASKNNKNENYDNK